MTQPQQPDLVLPNDPAWTAFKNQDETWFLKAASDEVRRYCGWHLTPSVTATYTQLPIGQKGIIMLPSRHVTAVTEVSVDINDNAGPQILDPDSYEWFEAGWIESSWPTDVAGGFYYGYGPAFLPTPQGGLADVTMTHGWDVLPNDIKEVVMELAAQGAMHAAASNVEEVASPGFKLKLREGGMAMSGSQKCRLASYKIGATR